MTGARTWVIADGWIPPYSGGPQPEMESHESICMVNLGTETAEVELVVFFTDRNPAGPYRFTIEPERALHRRINDLSEPEVVPRGVDFSMRITATEPIVVQHTRVDTRRPELAVLSTIAYPA